MTTNNPKAQDVTEPDQGPLVTRRWFAGWLTVLAVLSVIVAIWNAITPIAKPDALETILAWPVYIHPWWISITIALIVLGIISQIYSRQQARDAARAAAANVWICTECDSAGWPGSHVTAKDHRSASGHMTRSGGPDLLAGYHPEGLTPPTSGAQIVRSDYSPPGDR